MLTENSKQRNLHITEYTKGMINFVSDFIEGRVVEKINEDS